MVLFDGIYNMMMIMMLSIYIMLHKYRFVFVFVFFYPQKLDLLFKKILETEVKRPYATCPKS